MGERENGVRIISYSIVLCLQLAKENAVSLNDSLLLALLVAFVNTTGFPDSFNT
jgi:hypothetical protein